MKEYINPKFIVNKMTACEHTNLDLSFNEEEAKNMSAEEIREKWPRLICPDCNSIVYRSFIHYLMGDW